MDGILHQLFLQYCLFSSLCGLSRGLYLVPNPPSPSPPVDYSPLQKILYTLPQYGDKYTVHLYISFPVLANDSHVYVWRFYFSIIFYFSSSPFTFPPFSYFSAQILLADISRTRNLFANAFDVDPVMLFSIWSEDIVSCSVGSKIVAPWEGELYRAEVLHIFTEVPLEDYKFLKIWVS
jgi:hypothetical protein